MQVNQINSDITNEDYKRIREGFQSLMGINGDPFVAEIINTGALSPRSYAIITDNVSYNGQFSVMEHFGMVQWYHYQYARKYQV